MKLAGSGATVRLIKPSGVLVVEADGEIRERLIRRYMIRRVERDGKWVVPTWETGGI